MRNWLIIIGVLGLFAAFPASAQDGDDGTMTVVEDGDASEESLALPDEASEEGEENSAFGLDTANEARDKRRELGEARAEEAREAGREAGREADDSSAGGRP